MTDSKCPTCNTFLENSKTAITVAGVRYCKESCCPPSVLRAEAARKKADADARNRKQIAGNQERIQRQYAEIEEAKNFIADNFVMLAKCGFKPLARLQELNNTVVK